MLRKIITTMSEERNPALFTQPKSGGHGIAEMPTRIIHKLPMKHEDDRLSECGHAQAGASTFVNNGG